MSSRGYDRESKVKDEEFQRAAIKITLLQIAEEKKEIENNRKANRNLGIVVSAIIAFALIDLNLLMVFNYVALSPLALIVEGAAVFLLLILIVQYSSLKGEIEKLTMNLERLITYNAIHTNTMEFPMRNREPELYGKAFDVKKNTIDKLFEKLKTFANTWLVVAGGLVTSILIEVFKSSNIEVYSTLAIIVTAILVWDIAQNCYGILNYELVKKTKDLAFWWIALV